MGIRHPRLSGKTDGSRSLPALLPVSPSLTATVGPGPTVSTAGTCSGGRSPSAPLESPVPAGLGESGVLEALGELVPSSPVLSLTCLACCSGMPQVPEDQGSQIPFIFGLDSNLLETLSGRERQGLSTGSRPEACVHGPLAELSWWGPGAPGGPCSFLTATAQDCARHRDGTRQASRRA